jgi:hypothetical protein
MRTLCETERQIKSQIVSGTPAARYWQGLTNAGRVEYLELAQREGVACALEAVKADAGPPTEQSTLLASDLAKVIATERRGGALRSLTSADYDILCDQLARVCRGPFYGFLDYHEHAVGRVS